MAPLTFLASLSLALSHTLLTSSNAATVHVTNRCTYPVWAAAAWPSSPPLGRRLDNGQSWPVNVPPGTVGARVWGRTKCDGRHCETGDCNNGAIECTSYGQPPNTLAEFALNQPNSLDYVDISLVDGFNIPMEFSPVNGGACRNLRCTAASINAECPGQLRVPGGCNNPCTVYKTIQYCCTPQRGSCGPTPLSRFFKERCPNAYSYPQDDPTSQFTCPAGTNYNVIFCP